MIFAAILSLVTAAQPSAAKPTLQQALTNDVRRYLNSRRRDEHISAVSVSVGLRGRRSTIDLAAGQTLYRGDNAATPQDLFQIGSITKSFTAVLVLQLQAQHKLSLDDTLGKWLPQYTQWKHITLRRLLNLTNGIESFDENETFQRTFSAAPRSYMSARQLIGFIDPKTPLKPGYYYSNTAYILTELIIERAAHETYGDLLRRRLFAPVGLRETYYEDNLYPPAFQARMVAGYWHFSPREVPGFAPLYNTDAREHTPSVLRATGGVVSTPRDVVRWVRALFAGPLLSMSQRTQLENLVSVKTGRPMAHPSQRDPAGFGLGVAVAIHAPFGTFWSYEGETYGYRAAYVYIPASGAVIAVALNSAVLPDDDRWFNLVSSLYQTLRSYKML